LPHKLRKVRKMRGSRTHGYGQIGQHRKGGSKGGRKAGRHKHGWTYVIKYEPNYFEKRGFTSQKSLREKINVINVGELDELVDKLAAEGKLERKGKETFLDLDKLGYNKLLGMGKITKLLMVKASSYSEVAAKKIEEVGGKITKEHD